MYNRRGKNLFKALIFFYWQATSMDKSNLRNIVGCYQNRNPLQAFVWGYYHLQSSEEIASGGVTF